MRFAHPFRCHPLRLLQAGVLAVACLALTAPLSAAVSSTQPRVDRPLGRHDGPSGGLLCGAAVGTVLTLKELLDKRKELRDKVKALLDKAKAENRDLNEDESRQTDEHLEQAEQLTGQIDQRQRAEQRQSRLAHLDQRLAGPGTPPARGPEPGGEPDPVEQPDEQRYSLLRAISLRAAGKPLDGYEAEVSQEIAERSGKDPQGFYVPLNLLVDTRRAAQARGVERRDLDTTAGAGSIPTIQSGTFIDILRNRVLLSQLGAQMLAGMQGDFEIPKQTGAGSAYWVSEAGSPTESQQAIGQVAFSPSTVGAFTDITRRFMRQSSVDAEQFVRNDLTRVLALEIDRAGFNGSGAGAEPEGILQNVAVPTVALGANGAAPTWAALVQMETEIAQDNADLGTLAYVFNAKGRGKLKTTEKAAGYPVYLWGDDNTVNGYQARATNQLPSNLTKGTGTDLSAAVFGDFSSVLIAMWGGLDIMVDPYTFSSSGSVRVVALQDLDIQLRRTESFSKIVDLLTT